MIAQIKRERTANIDKLERVYFATNPRQKKPLKCHNASISQLDKLKLELNLALMAQLALCLHPNYPPRIHLHVMSQIRIPGHGLTDNPRKILEAIQIFYTKLYKAPPSKNKAAINQFLDTLPIPVLSPEPKNSLEAPFSEEVLVVIRELKKYIRSRPCRAIQP